MHERQPDPRPAGVLPLALCGIGLALWCSAGPRPAVEARDPTATELREDARVSAHGRHPADGARGASEPGRIAGAPNAVLFEPTLDAPRVDRRAACVRLRELAAEILRSEAVEAVARGEPTSFALRLVTAADLQQAMAASLREGPSSWIRVDGDATGEGPMQRLVLASRLLAVAEFAATANASALAPVEVVIDLRRNRRLADSLARWNRAQFAASPKREQELAEVLLEDGYRTVGAMPNCGR